MAYFLVHSFAQSLYLFMSVLYSLAISGTRGSSGLGSQSREQIDNNTWITITIAIKITMTTIYDT